MTRIFIAYQPIVWLLFVAHGFTFFAAEGRENQPGYMGGLRVYALE